MPPGPPTARSGGELPNARQATAASRPVVRSESGTLQYAHSANDLQKPKFPREGGLTKVDLLDGMADVKAADCLRCGGLLEAQCSLRCSHVVCKACSESCSTDDDGPVQCSICRCESQMTDGCPKLAPLVRLLLSSYGRSADAEVCANCDQHSDTMCFCKTCRQLLCVPCRLVTHQAKVFLSHEVVFHQPSTLPLGGQLSTKCELHNEEITFYSGEHGSFACSRCLDDSSDQRRQKFVDLDVAYQQSSALLMEASQLLNKYEIDLNAEMSTQQRWLEETARVKRFEVESVQSLYEQLVQKLKEARDGVLSSIETRYNKVEAEMEKNAEAMCCMLTSARVGQKLVDLVASWSERVQVVSYANDLHGFVKDWTVKRAVPCCSPRRQVNSVNDFFRLLECSGLGSFAHQKTNTSFGFAGDHQKSNSRGSSYTASSGSMTSGYHSFGSSSSAQSHGTAGDFLRRDVGGVFAERFGNIHFELMECRKHFSGVVQQALELQRDVTLRKCLTDSSKFYDVQRQGHKLKILLGAHSSKVDELQPTFQQIWEEELDRVKVQQEVYRNHVNTVADLRRDLQQLITASEQMVPFVDTIFQAIMRVDPVRGHSEVRGPMEQLCSQIATLEPNSQVRVSAIERQEHLRRADIEKKRLQACNVLADVKRLLKSPTEPTNKLKPGGQVVFDVQRDRAEQKPPCSRRQKRNSGSQSTGTSNRSSAASSCTAGSDAFRFFQVTDQTADLEASFGMIFAREAIYPMIRSKNDGSAGEPTAPSNTVNCSANFDLRVQSKGVSALMHKWLWKQTFILPYSLSIAAGDPAQQELDAKENGFDLSVEEVRESLSSPAASPCELSAKDLIASGGIIYARLPQTILSQVQPSTLEAREKMLASLKSKISRQGSPDC